MGDNCITYELMWDNYIPYELMGDNYITYGLMGDNYITYELMGDNCITYELMGDNYITKLSEAICTWNRIKKCAASVWKKNYKFRTRSQNETEKNIFSYCIHKKYFL